MITWSYKKFICNEEGCGKTFNTRWTLKRHYATHEQSNAVFNCSLCDKFFSRKDSLDRYLKLCHSSSLVLYICPIEDCGKVFNLKSTFRRHMNSHTDCYKCDDCDSTFSRKDNLDRHKASHTEKLSIKVEAVTEPYLPMQDNTKDMVLKKEEEG